MKKIISMVIVLLSLDTVISAQESNHQMNMGPAKKPATLMTGLGSLHHPVATSKPEAQRFLDQGLALVYAFNHDEAVRSFKRAAELDGHPLADEPERIRQAATEIVERHPDASPEDVVLWAEARALPAA